MTTLTYDPDNTLAGGLYALSPREVIRLGISLCEAVEDSVGADGCHGSVWPGNITQRDERAAIGPTSTAAISEMDPDALEFIAPEQFWNGNVSAASDVYSIGLILYTALNDGVMPFFQPGAEHTPENRAFALQNRMKGAMLPAPRSAGRELWTVVEKALSFRAEDRYPKPAALKLALEALPEAAVIPAVAPLVHLTEEEMQNTRSYKVDKDFEKIAPGRPQKQQKPRKKQSDVDENMDAKEFRTTPKRKGRWILPVILVLLIAAAVAFLLRSCRDYYDPNFPVDTDEPSAQPTETENLIHPPVPDETPVPVTPEPSEPVETEDPSLADKPKYEIFLEDVTWEQAKAKCEELGGHLATVKNDDQLSEIISLANEKGATYVWLGAYRADNGHWYCVTGEALDFTVWDTGEPSARDMDGTREDYLLLWYRKNLGVWRYNDMRNDPCAVAASYRGKLAYVCQYHDD